MLTRWSSRRAFSRYGGGVRPSANRGPPQSTMGSSEGVTPITVSAAVGPQEPLDGRALRLPGELEAVAHARRAPQSVRETAALRRVQHTQAVLRAADVDRMPRGLAGL